MTIQDLMTKLSDLYDSLDQANKTGDASALSLHILILQLRRELLVAAFDPLKGLSNVSVADIGALTALIPQAQAAIDDENQRVALVGKITATAKIALRAAGIALA